MTSLGPSAQADTEEGESLTNTGVSYAYVEAEPLTGQALQEANAKDAQIATLAAQLEAEVPPDSYPNEWASPEGSNLDINSQNKSYTCGPASVRNMTMTMNKFKNGTYWSNSEATLEGWLHTTSAGTAIGDIVNVLNREFSRFGSWKLKDPGTRWKYLAMIMTDTYYYRQPVIQGVDTGWLPYFNGKNLAHFNVAWGWKNTSSTKHIKILEVWDPIKIYGSSSYGNPYGHRTAPLYNAFKANDESGPFNGGKRLVV